MYPVEIYRDHQDVILFYSVFIILLSAEPLEVTIPFRSNRL